jgi:tRNA A-37 threonylcarbamoyl transferase component Bud32/tetratricopeptide (TPR) repeat protein
VARCPTCHRRLLSGRPCIEHGGAAESSSQGEVGAAPDWTPALERCIGSGGFAAVWQIAGTSSVLKVAHANHELSRARMAREAEALAAIGAPAAPGFLGSGTLTDGRAWIEMERVSGTNLSDLVAAGPIRIDHVISLGVQIAEALQRIHDAGYAHRDLKPDNILRRADGSLVILDLGLARKLPDDPDDPNRAGVQVGSVEYMAPEQALDGTTARAAADIYAVGCILYELCSGRPPFVGEAAALERAHAALRPPPLSALVPVPVQLELLVHDCLAKQPNRRPARAVDVATRLREVGDAEGQRTQHSMSVIGAGKQPVVLLWAELPKVDRALIGTLTARKVTIVSQRGRKILGAVAGVEHADPAGAALAAARDLAAAGARVALHLDAVEVAHGPAGLQLTGPSIQRPEDWLPQAPWTGVILSRTLATIAQVPTRAIDAIGFVALGEPGMSADELFGREALLSDLVTEAAAALSGIGPGLAVLVGDHGIGKTAIARALAPRLAELGARVISGAVPPPGSGRPGYTALGELVVDSAQPVVRAVGDALRDAARQGPTAIILDELHLAEHELLDALEYATLGGEPLPLWIVGFAVPRFDQRRPGFGTRAERPLRQTIAALDETAALEMTAALLRPAEYPPLRALRQIASIARGNPMHLATLVREIHDRGAIRTRPNGEHFLDTTALETLPPIALGPWLAARELASLGVELVSLARVCAILGDELDLAQVAGVIGIAERRGSATTSADLEVGLAELVANGVLVAGRGTWVFRQALLEEGIYLTTNEAERSALHAAALEYWQTKPMDPAVAARIARHAEAIGERRIAAAAFARLGAHAHEEHHTLDADQAWQGAVRNLDARDLERGRALLGRARARYRLQRVRDALADLDEALAIAGELGDSQLEIEAMLEKATALDWGDDFDSSALIAEEARERLDPAEHNPLQLAADLAIGRSLFRRGAFVEAAPQLEGVMTAARGRDREIETIAGVLLAPVLVELGSLSQAEVIFADVIRLCEESGDRLHYGAAHANRAWLWSKRGEVEQTANDLRVVIQVARENGQATLERIATYNLAEDRLWQGALDEASQLARRSLAIQKGHGEGDTNLDLMLLARVLAARGERDELATVLSAIKIDDVSDADRLVIAVLECARDRAPVAAWQASLAATADLPSDTRLELAHLAARADALDPALRAAMRDVARKHPIWARRSEL